MFQKSKKGCFTCVIYPVLLVRVIYCYSPEVLVVELFQHFTVNCVFKGVFEPSLIPSFYRKLNAEISKVEKYALFLQLY